MNNEILINGYWEDLGYWNNDYTCFSYYPELSNKLTWLENIYFIGWCIFIIIIFNIFILMPLCYISGCK